MDETILHLWAAGYDLPPEPHLKGGKPIIEALKEPAGFGLFRKRGKKVSKAKRERAK